MTNKAKLTFELLEQEMEIFSKEELRRFMGGTYDPIVMQFNLNGGGSVQSWDFGGEMGAYSIVTTPDGRQFVFDGVDVSSGGAPDGSGMSINGTIYMGTGGLSINEFINEYGHYLQQEEMGLSYGGVILESGYKHLSGSDDYYSTGYEYDASDRGNFYMDYYYPNSGYSAPTTD